MRNDWILDVLTDLRTFAEQNGMSASADHLSDACLVVAAELSQMSPRVPSEQAGAHDGTFEGISGLYPAR